MHSVTVPLLFFPLIRTPWQQQLRDCVKDQCKPEETSCWKQLCICNVSSFQCYPDTTDFPNWFSACFSSWASSEWPVEVRMKDYNWVTIQIQVPAVRPWSGCKRSYLKTWVSDLLNPLCMSVSWCVRRRYLSSTWLLTHWEHYSSRASCHPDHVDLLTFCVFRHLSLIFVLLL